MNVTQQNQILEMLKTLYEPSFASTASSNEIITWRYHSGKWDNSPNEKLAIKLTLTN